jgi:hypothetical protein
MDDIREVEVKDSDYLLAALVQNIFQNWKNRLAEVVENW